MSKTDDDSPRNADGKFKKGHTGNRKGAPSKSSRKPVATAFDILSHADFDPIASDLPKDVAPAHEAAFRTLQAAFMGSKRARRQVLGHIVRRAKEKILLDQASDPGPSVGVTVEFHDPRNADEALRLLGIAIAQKTYESDKYMSLKIALWAVQLAISRRHGGRRLSPDYVQRIELVTDSADKLQWPVAYAHRSPRANRQR